MLSGNRDTAEELVQATCVRALERAQQFTPGTRLDRWLFAILHSIWLNEVRARKVRLGQGLVDADAVLVFDGLKDTEANIWAGQVLREVQALPEAQRETVFLVYVEGMTYREAAEAAGRSDRDGHVAAGSGAGETCRAECRDGDRAEGNGTHGRSGR